MNPHPETGNIRRFRAFISYSQKDGIAAEALHRRLERYRVPRRLVGQHGRVGLVPATLAPVFRDREELAASADIGGPILAALRRSDFLIVLCSPNAARSQWVNEEITAFCSLSHGNRDRVLAVLLQGEPGSTDPASVCFPPALIGPEAESTLGSRYPLAADFRPGADHRGDAELRLIAALLGVEFQELKRRDQEHRIARLRISVAVMGSVLVGVAALAGYSLVQRDRAQRETAQAKLARSEAEKLVDFMLTDLRQKLEQIGKLDLLEPANEKVRTYYESMAPAENDPSILSRRALAFQEYAIDLRNHKNGAKTLSVLLTAAALRERLVQLTPHDPDAWQALAETRRFVAIQKRDDGNLDVALHDLSLAEAAQAHAVQLKPSDLEMAARLPSLQVERAAVLLRRGQTQHAADVLKPALQKLEEISARDPNNLETANRVAGTAWQLGNAYQHLRNVPESERAYQRGIEVGRALRAAGKKDIFSLRWLKTNEGGLGELYQAVGRNADAVPVLKASLSTAREVLAIDPHNLAYLDDVATDLDNLANALFELKRFDEALRYAKECVDVREAVISEGATDLRSRNTLALALSTFASIQIEQHQFKAAIATATRGVEVQRSASRQAPQDLRLRDDLGFMHSKLGDAFSAAKDFPAAENEYLRAIAIMDDILKKEQGAAQLSREADKSEWQLGLGTALIGEGRRKDGEAALRGCLTTVDEAERAGLPATRCAEIKTTAQAKLNEISAN